MANKAATQEDIDSVRESILDAAERCFSQYGTRKTSMADISDTANISRTTVYRYFNNREAVLEGVMLRDVSKLFSKLLSHLSQFTSTEERVVETLIYAMKTIENTPRLVSLLTPDAALLAASSNEIYRRLELFSQPLFTHEIFNDLNKLRRDVSPDQLKEFLIQTVYGLLTLKTPASESEQSRRDYIENFVLPVLFV